MKHQLSHLFLIGCLSVASTMRGKELDDSMRGADAPHLYHATRQELVGVFSSDDPTTDKVIGATSLYYELLLSGDNKYYMLMHSDIAPELIIDCGEWIANKTSVDLITDHRAKLSKKSRIDYHYQAYRFGQSSDATVRLLRGSLGYFVNGRITPRSLRNNRMKLSSASLLKQSHEPFVEKEVRQHLEKLLTESNNYSL